MVWMQGETDAYLQTPTDKYIKSIQDLADIMKEAGVEHCFVIQIGNGTEDSPNNIIQDAQKQLCQIDSFFDLVSTVPAELPSEYLDSMGIHFTQDALNLIGEDAGRNTANIVAAP